MGQSAAMCAAALALVTASSCGRIGYDSLFDYDPLNACTQLPALLTPSNGAEASHLLDVSAPLDVTESLRIDTDTGEIVTEAGGSVRPAGAGVAGGIRFEVLPGNVGLFAVEGLVIRAGAVLRASGQASLLILSACDVAIAGVIDVSAGVCGDGAEASDCGGPGGFDGATGNRAAAGCAPGGNGISDGDTGGGGGGLGQDGAAGGEETDGTLSPGGLGGAVSGSPCPDESLVPLLGGSGGGQDGNQIGIGGGGGGAVQITALGSIAFSGGGILAAGGGGRGGGDGSGGGGGGSGGAILLEAVSIDVGDAILAANGGGGGAGNGDASGATGTFGEQPAQGGGAGGLERPGGNGGSLISAPTAGTPEGNDTGGGGGGAGIIRLSAESVQLVNAVVSPQLQVGNLLPSVAASPARSPE